MFGNLIPDAQLTLLLQTAIPAILLWIAAVSFRWAVQRDALPLVNGKKRSELLWLSAKARFLCHAEQLLRSGFTKTQRIFRIYTETGYRVALAPEYANEIKSHQHLTQDGLFSSLFHSNIPGFEIFSAEAMDPELFRRVIAKKLTPSLGSLTQAISEQAAAGLQDRWGNKSDWKEIILKPTILRIVSRLSCRVFCGEELCSNDEWLKVVEDYTVIANITATKLWLWPGPIRQVVHWFLPSCRTLRAHLAEVRQILNPALERREMQRSRSGGDAKGQSDMIDWLEEVADGAKYDPVAAQLLLSVAAIHTTADLLTQVIYDIVEQEHLVDDLREEIISAIGAEGVLTGQCLPRLKLMDSVLKESQRLKPIGVATMNRIVTADCMLSDGSRVSKGSITIMPTYHMWDESVYPKAGEFIPDRFLKMREMPGHENLHQLVSTSPNHLGFGYGKYACPGRYFAANEVKIALCHVLLKYDIRLVGNKPEPQRFGAALVANMYGKVAIRRRQPDILI